MLSYLTTVCKGRKRSAPAFAIVDHREARRNRPYGLGKDEMRRRHRRVVRGRRQWLAVHKEACHERPPSLLRGFYQRRQVAHIDRACAVCDLGTVPTDQALTLLEQRRERGLELCGIEGATATVVLSEAQSADQKLGLLIQHIYLVPGVNSH